MMEVEHRHVGDHVTDYGRMVPSLDDLDGRDLELYLILPPGTWVTWCDGSFEGIGRVVGYPRPDDGHIILSHTSMFTASVEQKHILARRHLAGLLTTVEDVVPWLNGDWPQVWEMAQHALVEIDGAQ